MRRRKGFTLVEIMIVVAIIALLAAIAVPNLLTARRSANDAAARANARGIATSAENFAIDNDGVYPILTANLDTYTPHATRLCGGGVIGGFTYTCTWGALGIGYTIAADPASANTGNINVTVTTGGVMNTTAAVF